MNVPLTDVPRMTGPSGTLAGSITALASFFQRWYRQADTGSLADSEALRPVVSGSLMTVPSQQ